MYGFTSLLVFAAAALAAPAADVEASQHCYTQLESTSGALHYTKHSTYWTCTKTSTVTTTVTTHPTTTSTITTTVTKTKTGASTTNTATVTTTETDTETGTTTTTITTTGASTVTYYPDFTPVDGSLPSASYDASATYNQKRGLEGRSTPKETGISQNRYPGPVCCWHHPKGCTTEAKTTTSTVTGSTSTSLTTTGTTVTSTTTPGVKTTITITVQTTTTTTQTDTSTTGASTTTTVTSAIVGSAAACETTAYSNYANYVQGYPIINEFLAGASSFTPNVPTAYDCCISAFGAPDISGFAYDPASQDCFINTLTTCASGQQSDVGGVGYATYGNPTFVVGNANCGLLVTESNTGA